MTPQTAKDFDGAKKELQPGWYWARWQKKAPGTSDPDDEPDGNWEVVEVVENCLDPTDDEFLAVMVAGVAKWQWPKDFIWGDRIRKPLLPE